jgi:hypothetical protein
MRGRPPVGSVMRMPLLQDRPTGLFGRLRGVALAWRRALSFLIAVLVARAAAIGAQADTLALINGEPLASDAFRYRFELSVYPGKDNPTSLDSTKKQFLLSLIAERLLSLSAQTENLVDAEDEKIRREAEDMFLRDALFRKEVVSKVKISREEISTGLRLLPYSYLVDALYFPDSLNASRFYRKVALLPEGQFYAAVESSRVSHDTLQIGFGESTERIERAFFGRKAGFISQPTWTEDGFVVFRVLDRQVNKRFASASLEERERWVENIIKRRREEQSGFEYLSKLMHGIKVNVNSLAFRPLALAIQSRLKLHRPTPNDPHYHLSFEDITSFRSSLSRYLNEPVLQLDTTSMMLDEVLEKLPFAGFTALDATIGEVTSGLHTSLKFIAQNYFVSKRARELGLQDSPEVRDNVRLVLDAFRAFRVAELKTETATVSEAEVDSFFNVHRDIILDKVALRVEQYAASNIDEAADVFNRLNQREHVETLSSPTPSSEAQEDSLWIRASKLGETGAVIAQLKPGQIYGPVPEGGHYIIYRLLDKKSAVNDSVLANSIRVARDVLLAQKKRRVLNEYLARLAEENNVKIFFNNLRQLNVTPLQMYTLRYLGFGGKVAAVPPLYPREDWVKYLQKKASVIQ